jgi:predicted nucleic acid-binding protein
MVKALFDTCILIDHLRGIGLARDAISRYRDRAISRITWIEVMIGANADVEDGTRAFLDEFELVEVDRLVAERAVQVRKARNVKLPDAIIQASAEVGGMLLLTRNTKDFPKGLEFVEIPYEL